MLATDLNCDHETSTVSFQSSIDRGCCSCECLLVGDCPDGLTFWQSKLGKTRVDALVAETGNRPSHQIVIEISRPEMRLLLDEPDDDDEVGADQHESDDLED